MLTPSATGLKLILYAKARNKPGIVKKGPQNWDLSILDQGQETEGRYGRAPLGYRAWTSNQTRIHRILDHPGLLALSPNLPRKSATRHALNTSGITFGGGSFCSRAINRSAIRLANSSRLYSLRMTLGKPSSGTGKILSVCNTFSSTRLSRLNYKPDATQLLAKRGRPDLVPIIY